jgi:acyl-CoA synthetase
MGFDPADVARYHEAGWWADGSFGERIAELARTSPDGLAWITPDERVTWARYDEVASAWAGALVDLGLAPGDRVAVQLPDGAAVHAAFVAVERAGLVIVGIGHRAGEREVRHLLDLTGARTMIAAGDPPAGLDHVVLVPGAPALGDGRLVVDGVDVAPGPRAGLPGLHPDELWLLNSTSGTTGLPKCVMHNQNRWRYFHQLAVAAGGLDEHDVFMSALPAPFGFGIWTAHVSPTLLGVPTVVVDRFDAGAVLDLIERERVTVLCCVSTQFIMLLNEQAERPRDVSSLRAMFTGGEAVPYERAAEFEETTGAALLQFYGSNETGALSHTSRESSRDRRLRSAGLVIPEMEVRLLDPDTLGDVEVPGRGQPACKGPATCLGYWGDEDANAKLYTADGWMLMGDIVTIDVEGELQVVGRTSDFIIRGGKNISAPAVEEEVGTHPDVAMVAAVAAPDPVFGERVAVYVEPRPGASITLESIVSHLRERGVSKEWFPEHLHVVDALPRSSGGKVAKGDLRQDATTRFASS